MRIITGKQAGALKTVIYGPEGIGKSTLAARFPRPLFIDTEGSTRHMDVARMEKPSSWTMLLEQVRYIRNTPGVCETLAIDTADWAEQLCIRSICASKEIGGIEDMGYGRGYVYLAEEFGKLLNLLEEVVDRGVHVVLTAHAMMRKFEQPDEMGAYDRWELKLQKKTAPLVKEWSDLLLFANYKTIAVATDEKGKKFKAQGGRRVLYTAHHPCWDAKNRLDLPEELPLDFTALAPYIFPAAPAQPEPAPPPDPDKTPPPSPGGDPGPSPQDSPGPARPAGQSGFVDVQHAAAGPQPGSATAEKTHIARPAGPGPDSGIPAALLPLLESANVTEDEVREVIAQKGYFTRDTPWAAMESSGFVEGWVLPFWDRIVEMIENNPDRLPF